MANQESVINALLAAIENDPADVSLRLHVASLLLAEGNASAAWDHLKVALENAPDNREVLTRAAQATESLGRRPQAAAYRRISEALQKKSDAESRDEDGEILFEYDDSRQTTPPVSNMFGGGDQSIDTRSE